jgi:hypothetical protein
VPIVRIVLALAVLLVAGTAAGRARPLRVPLTPFEVPPGRDRIPCEYIELPNSTAVDVRRFEVRAPRTRLHHILLYAYLGDDRDPRYLTHGLRDDAGCIGLGPPDMASHTLGLLGAVRAGVYALPEGYAVSLRPRQPVSVSMHAFNTKRKPRRAVVRLTLVPAAPGEVRHHLEPIDIVNVAFELPPQAHTVHTADFIAPLPMNVAMVSSHQHRFGTRVTIQPIVGGAALAPLYENVRWREPPLRWLDPPLRLEPGDRLRVRCEWYNRSDATLRYGNSANDEMCNLNGYFFRDEEVAPEARTGVGGFLVPVVE